MNSNLIRLSLTLILALAAAGCSDDSGSAADAALEAGADQGPGKDVGPGKETGPQPDKGPLPDKGPPKPDGPAVKWPFACKGDCRSYVVDRLTVPTSTTESQLWALSFKGKKYNALGAMLSLLAQQAPGAEIKEAVLNDVCAGKTINLLKIKVAPPPTSNTALQAQAWIGQPAPCCAAKICLDSKDKTVCKAAATQVCYAKTGSFNVDKGKPGQQYLQGKITAGKLSARVLGGDKKQLSVRISLSGGGGLDVPLLGATYRGDFSADEIKLGVLTGAIPNAALGQTVIPETAKILNSLVQGTKDAKTKALILGLFDTNKDNKIDAAEVSANPLLKPYLAGDVDVDGDGKLDFSVGLAFTAVKATINP